MTIGYVSLFISIALGLSLPPALYAADGAKEPLYTQITRAVVRLEHAVSSPAGRAYRPDGTAFFVAYGDNLFVITARHVVDKDYDLRARVPSLVVTTAKTEVIELRLARSRWIFHPSGGDDRTHPVDVAVMKLPGIRDRRVSSFRYCPENCPEGSYNQLAEDSVPPQEIIVFGFPLDIGFELKEPRPMLRRGAIAMVAAERFIQLPGPTPDSTPKYAPEGSFLLDIDVHPGNSGSPIITDAPFQRLSLAGLVSAANYRLKYGVATPTSDIAETLQVARDSAPAPHSWFALNDERKEENGQ